MGLQNYNSMQVSSNRKKVSQIFSNVLSAKILLVLLFSIVVAAVGFVMYPEQKYLSIIFGLILIFSLQSMYIYLRSHFSAIGKFKTETYLSALDKLLMIFILGYFIYIAKDIDIQKFISGQVAAYLFAICVALFLLRKSFSVSVRFSFSETKALIRKSAPFALVVLLMTLYTRMDGVMLEALLDDNARSAGQYATGFRLMDAANVVGYLFAVLLLPMFANMMSEKKNLNPLIKEATGLLFSISTIISIASWFYAEDILTLIYDDISTQNIVTFKYLMVSFWAMSMSYIFGSLITASGKLKKLNIIFIIGIIINWGLNLWLIPSEFAIGAAKATLITQSFVFFAQYVIALSQFKISYGSLFVGKGLLLLGIYFALSILLYRYVPVYWGFKLMTFIILSTIASFFAGFFRLSLRDA